MIAEHSLAVLDCDPPHDKLDRGDVGTVVHVYKGGRGYEVEFVDGSGQTVALVARAAGLWVTNACRVVYVVEEDEPLRRLAFAYGTLADHAERGEERFQVEWRHDDDTVWYDILAFSRPQQWLSRLAKVYVRRKQKQFGRESALAMQSAVAGDAEAH